MHSYVVVEDEFFADCDFHSASNEIIRSLKGREIPIELGVLLHNYVKYPSKITAIPLIKYDQRFAAFFNGRPKAILDPPNNLIHIDERGDI